MCHFLVSNFVQMGKDYFCIIQKFWCSNCFNVEIFRQNGKNCKTLLIAFLFVSLKLIIQSSPRFDQMFGCSNMLNSYSKRERLQDASYYFSFLVFCIKHSFVIWVSKTNLTIFCMIQTDISMSCSKPTLSIFLFLSFYE